MAGRPASDDGALALAPPIRYRWYDRRDYVLVLVVASFWRPLALFVAVASISIVFLIVSFYAMILIAAAQCPDDAYECLL